MAFEEFDTLKKKFMIDKAKRENLSQMITKERNNISRLENSLSCADKGLAILQKVAQDTQKNLEYHLSNLVSTALASVLPDPPEFLAEIEIKRKKTECNFYFVYNGEKARPIDSSGGGPLDIASFALRLSFWSLNKTAPIFLLDEPFKFVSPDLQHKVSDMIKMLSKDLNIQIVMVSHADDINYSADKTFTAKRNGPITLIEEGA